MWSTAKIATASNSTLSRCDSIWSAERFVGQWFATIHCDQFALARDRLIKDHVIIWSAVLQDRNVPWPVCFGTSMNWSRIHLPIYGDMCRGLIHSVTHSHFLGRLRAINCNACQSKARIVDCSHCHECSRELSINSLLYCTSSREAFSRVASLLPYSVLPRFDGKKHSSASKSRSVVVDEDARTRSICWRVPKSVAVFNSKVRSVIASCTPSLSSSPPFLLKSHETNYA